jgi:V-type H+-transporting ATPase subunit H
MVRTLSNFCLELRLCQVSEGAANPGSGIPPFLKTILEYPDPYKSLLPFLAQSANPEDPIPLLTSTVLASLIAASAASSPEGTPAVDKAMPKLLSYLSTLAQASDGGVQDIAVLQFSSLLRGKKSREIFWQQRGETVKPLIRILKTAAGVATNEESSSTLWSGAGSIRTVEGSLGGGVGLQLLYHVLLVLWQLSFDGALIGDGLEEYATPHGRYLSLIANY